MLLYPYQFQPPQHASLSKKPFNYLERFPRHLRYLFLEGSWLLLRLRHNCFRFYWKCSSRHASSHFTLPNQANPSLRRPWLDWGGCLRSQAGYLPRIPHKIFSSDLRLKWALLRKSYSLASRGGIPIEVQGQRRMLRTLSWIDWALVTSLSEMVKLWFQTNRGWRTKHMTLFTKICGKRVYQAPRMFSSISKTHKLSNQ